MKDQKKTKAQLIAELQKLRRRVSDFDNSEKHRKPVVENEASKNLHRALADTPGDRAGREHSAEHERATARRLSTLIAHLPGGIVLETPDRQVLQTNEKFCEMFGIDAPPEALKGADCHQAAQQVKHLFTDCEAFITGIDDILAAGQSVLNEELILRDGRVFERDYVPVETGNGQVENLWYYRDVSQTKQATSLLTMQSEVLQMIALGTGLPEVLERLCLLIEKQSAGALCSILLLDETEGKLRSGAAPSLPKKYARALDGLIVGEAQGSCGTAVARGKQVIVHDIAKDPLWAGFRKLALKHGIRSCWSTPFFSREDTVLGTLAISHKIPCSPTPYHRQLIQTAAHLAGIATERQKVEKKMISSEHKYRVLTENAPIGIYYNDLNGTFLYGNRKAEEVTGYERDALIGKNFLKLKLLGPKSIMKAAKLLALNKLGKSTGPDYFTLNRKDGTQRQVEICTEIINIDEKRVVLGMVQDITERNQTEEALRESERKFREMTDLLPQIVYETDLLGNFTFVNKHGYMTFGYSENDLKTGFNMLQTLIPEDRDRAKENIQSIMSGKPSKNTEYTVVKKDGSTFPVLVYSNPVLKNHKPVGMRGIIIDITERKRAEEALIASKSRLMAIFDNSPVAIYEADAEGKCLFVNKKWCEFAGLTPEEARGDGWQRALHPDDREHIFKVWSQHAHSNKSWNFEYRFNTPTNVITHVWGTASALRNEHGEITGYIGVNIDITERRQAEQALRESEERFRIFVEHAADSFYLLDLNGRLVDVNSAACTSLGYTREELLSLSVPDIDVDFPADKLADFLGNLTEGEAVTVEGKQKRKDGSTFPVELRVGRLGTEMQPMILALARDITERRQAEEALHKSEEKYRKIFENVRDVYYQTGYDGTITEISPSIERHSGYTREALIGTQIVDFYFYPKDYLELCEKLEQNGEVNDFEIRLKDKHGRLNYGSVNARIVFDVDGKPIATEGTLRDITDRRQAEKEKANLERQLHLAKKMETIGTLAGGIAHDFNNILQPILGYTEMALSSLPATDPLSDDLQQILDGANRAKDLVNQILTFSRQHEQERKPLQLQLIIQEALKLMRPSIPTTIEIRKRIDSSCEKVSADATQIHQVIVNLCTNAFQVMEEKGGVLTIELKQVEVNAPTAKLYSNLQQKEYALLTIRDTGIGMDQATLERVFEPFFTTKMVDGGTGLGLSVVHGIIRSHQGEIIVKSELGKGSTFQVYLPILTDRRQSGEKDVESIPVGQEFILVVDDEEAIIGVMKKMLGRLGYRVIAKNSSIEGLKAFRERPAEYDLVITDLTMPNLTGLELAKEIGKIRSGIPVILMTGYGENIKGDLQKDYGIQAIVGKPIMFRELAAMIRKVIKSN